MIRTLFRVVGFALQNMWRNAWVAFMTIAMLSLSLISFHVLLGLQVVAQEVVEFIEHRVEVAVHFEPEIPPERFDSALAYIRSLPQVRDVVIVTPEEAFADFQARYADDDAIRTSAEKVGDTLFGPELVIKVESTDDFPFLLDALSNPQYEEFIAEKDFVDYATVVEQIRRTVRQVEWVTGLVALVFFLSMLALVFHLVRVSTYLHREEITIMKLVGATNFFVKAPFVLEAVFTSWLAVVFVTLVTLPLMGVVSPFVRYLLPGNTLQLEGVYLHALPWLLPIEAVSLALLTGVASLAATRQAR